MDIGESVIHALTTDIDNDTNPDLAILVDPAAASRQIRFFQGDGAGAFTPVGSNLELQKGGNTFTKEDFNNDGNIDFLSLASDGDIFVGDGAFGFSHTSTNTGVSLVEHSTEVKDIDGDGIKDLINGSECSICSPSSTLQINKGNGDGTFSASFWSRRLVGGYRIIVSDFNNDGKNDIATLVNNSTFNGLSILLNTTIPPACNPADITSNPSSATLCEGGADYTISISATGDAPLTYQWQKEGVNISGAPNTATYTLNNYTTAESGVYRCVVSNACGTDTSSGATITIIEIPKELVTIGATGCSPASVVLTASGVADGNYRWYDVLTGGSSIAGEVNNSFTTPVLSVSTNYFVAAIENTCEGNRVIATATILAPVSITTPPVDQNVALGDDATLTIIATGDNLAYQWQKEGADITGETSTSLLISNISVADEGNYACVVSNSCSSKTSNIAAVSILQITGIDENQSALLVVYPNPSSGIIQLITKQTKGLTAKVYSIHGQVVYAASLSPHQLIIDLSKLPSGTYNLEITGREVNYYKKILINK